MAVEIARYSFTVDEYHRMAEAGIFSEDARIELISGEVIQMTPIGSRHAGCVARLDALLHDALGNRAVIFVQNPIGLSSQTEPQPDVSVLRPRADYYAAALPAPPDILLVVEVADSSLEYDRLVKVPLYAQAGLPEVWIVNLRDGVIETSRQPANGAYQDVETAGTGETVRGRAVPGLAFAAADVRG